MKKKKSMLQTIIQDPLSRIKQRSGKAYDRYHELFRSIKKLARPPVEKNAHGERKQ